MTHRAYRTIAAVTEASFVVQKSRFIGTICPCTTESEANTFIEQRKKQYWNATHNVVAYTLLLGEIVRCSDDGEPQGSAGRPALQVLQQQQLWNVCVVVTRYFGGVLLGTGGLVRAYANATKLAVEQAVMQTMHWCEKWTLTFDYLLYGKMIQLLRVAQVRITDSVFGAQITLRLVVPQSDTRLLAQQLLEQSSGQLIPIMTGEGYATLPFS